MFGGELKIKYPNELFYQNITCILRLLLSFLYKTNKNIKEKSNNADKDITEKYREEKWTTTI